MRDYQRELDDLRERIAVRRHNQSVLENLRLKESGLICEVHKRREQLNKEQNDVDRLERVSLASVLAAIRGDKEEQIEREKAEALVARLHLQEAERALADLQTEMRERQSLVDANADCEERYTALLREKEVEYRAKDPVLAAKLAEVEQQELGLITRRREVEEALGAGRQALSRLDGALDKLGSAQNWGVWDLMSDGIMGDIMKYQRLDEAQRQIETLSNDLRRFRMELEDISWAESFDLRPGGWMEFADYVFDNIFTDWMVQDRIERSRQDLGELWGRVQNLLRQLEREFLDIEAALRRLQQERDEAVRQA